MKAKHDIETMREAAYAKQLEADDRLLIGDIEPDAADRARYYAQGVEAALLWALSDAGSPFQD